MQYSSEEYFENDLLMCIVDYYFIQEYIKEIGFDCSKETLKKNYNTYQHISDKICMMNMNSGAYECMCNCYTT